MKLSCDIVQDLLPLYEDGVCSPDSRSAVEEHLKTCPQCRGEQKTAQKLPKEELLADFPQDNKSVKCFKKIRRRWAISLIAMLLLVPVLLMSFNQARGAGACFTNLDEILLAKKFVRHLQNGEYSKAAEMYDFRPSYQSIMEALNTPQEAWGASFVECKIGDEIWYMNSGLLEDIDWGQDPDEVWMQLIFNRHDGILVPPEQMEKLAAMEPGIVSNDQDGYSVNGQNFYPLSTPWGTFLAEESAIDSFIQSDREILDYGNQFTLIPEEMYRELEPGLQERSRRVWDLTQELYAPVADMTEEEFCAYMRKKYAAELEEVFSGGIRLEGNHYTTSFNIDASGWTAGIQSVVVDDEGSRPITIYIHIGDGSVTDISMAYANDSLTGNALIETLFPSYG